MTRSLDEQFDTRVNLNHTNLVKMLVKHLETHKVEVHNFLDDTNSYPDSLDVYDFMLDTFIAKESDYQGFTFPKYFDVNDHFLHVLAFIQFTDEELEIRLVNGKTYIPDVIVENLHIPNTFYNKDADKIKPR